MFKWWSPISFGSWIVALSGVLPLISFVHALLEGGILRNGPALRITHALHDGGVLSGRIFLALAALLGLVLAGYTGILLAVNNAPTWSHDPLLPALFMASGVATAGGALFLISWASSGGAQETRLRVLRTAALALAFEAALLVVSVLSGIGDVSPLFLGWWAALFWAVLLPLGIVAPLVLFFTAFRRGRELVPHALPVAAALLIVGGLLFRLLEVFGGQAYYVAY
jgi:formate-dependent nitrite reductase membrane component NrfD